MCIRDRYGSVAELAKDSIVYQYKEGDGDEYRVEVHGLSMYGNTQNIEGGGIVSNEPCDGCNRHNQGNSKECSEVGIEHSGPHDIEAPEDGVPSNKLDESRSKQ
eukprot:TRINITY_DN44887_c0_g1_i1.p2 TRINITY_DN44887_c0_g1~~TRINITY_DN44887_c0_g1_i1.p2  ORF type:complete len:104 (+),score=5.18 TRINITY_DN44887_c0_g1_i1:80-391(+)